MIYNQVDLAMDVFKRIHPDEEIPEGWLREKLMWYLLTAGAKNEKLSGVG